MLAHSLQFSFLMAFGTNFIQHLVFLAIERKGTQLRRFGPLFCALVGMALLMMQPSLFVFQDVGCPVRCYLKDHASLLHACFMIGGLLMFTAAAWSMGFIDRITNRFMASSR
jgi:hypothetical protein